MLSGLHEPYDLFPAPPRGPRCAPPPPSRASEDSGALMSYRTPGELEAEIRRTIDDAFSSKGRRVGSKQVQITGLRRATTPALQVRTECSITERSNENVKGGCTRRVPSPTEPQRADPKVSPKSVGLRRPSSASTPSSQLQLPLSTTRRSQNPPVPPTVPFPAGDAAMQKRQSSSGDTGEQKVTSGEDFPSLPATESPYPSLTLPRGSGDLSALFLSSDDFNGLSLTFPEADASALEQSWNWSATYTTPTRQVQPIKHRIPRRPVQRRRRTTTSSSRRDISHIVQHASSPVSPSSSPSAVAGRYASFDMAYPAGEAVPVESMSPSFFNFDSSDDETMTGKLKTKAGSLGKSFMKRAPFFKRTSLE